MRPAPLTRREFLRLAGLGLGEVFEDAHAAISHDRVNLLPDVRPLTAELRDEITEPLRGRGARAGHDRRGLGRERLRVGRVTDGQLTHLWQQHRA